jgi:hypothetical protein
VFFCVVVFNADGCRPQRGKMISVVAYTAEKLLALLPTTQKNA